jgi:hypothetical protein
MRRLGRAWDRLAPMVQRLKNQFDGQDFPFGTYCIADFAFTPNLARQMGAGVGLPE